MNDAEIHELTSRIHPMLAGRDPAVVGAVLADCVALLIAGHVYVGEPDATATLRGELLAAHIKAVRDLIPINAQDARDHLILRNRRNPLPYYPPKLLR